MTRALLIGFTLAMTCMPAAASCFKDGKASESIELSVDGKPIDRWDTVHGKIHRIRLPSGFELGIQIDPTTREKYEEILKKVAGIDELLKITLFDMKGVSPFQLTENWGGANSKQGFGPRGGANKISAMPDQIELWLHKPVCITSANLPSS